MRINRWMLSAPMLAVVLAAGCANDTDPAPVPTRTTASPSATPTRSVVPTRTPATPTTKPTTKAPTTDPADPEPTVKRTTSKPKTDVGKEPSSVYYKNCDAVRKAGKAPLRSGQSGYRKGLDRDGDGIACDK